MFVAAWTTTIAYITASSYYQIATFTQHPLFSGLWLGGIVVLSSGLIYGLRQWALKGSKFQRTQSETEAKEMGA